MFRTFGLPIKSDLWSVYIPENTANGSILMPAKMEVELMNKGHRGYSTKIFWEHIFWKEKLVLFQKNLFYISLKTCKDENSLCAS